MEYKINTPYLERSVRDKSVFFLHVSSSDGTKLYNWLLVPQDALSDLFDADSNFFVMTLKPGELKPVQLSIKEA